VFNILVVVFLHGLNFGSIALYTSQPSLALIILFLIIVIAIVIQIIVARRRRLPPHHHHHHVFVFRPPQACSQVCGLKLPCFVPPN